MRTTRTNSRPVKTVETAFSILEFLKESDGATLPETASEFDVAKSTAHRHVATLRDLEYVIKEGNQYHPSLLFLDFAEYGRNRKRAYELAQEKVQELADETDERAQFIVEEHGMGVYVRRAAGKHAVRTNPGPGHQLPLHSVSSGKAILAHLPAAKVDWIISERGLPAITEHTITDREVLESELEAIRERGYSFNRQENIEGLNAVGAPVIGPDGRVVGALSVSGPTNRMKGEWFEQGLPDLLSGTANELELNIAHS